MAGYKKHEISDHLAYRKSVCMKNIVLTMFIIGEIQTSSCYHATASGCLSRPRGYKTFFMLNSAEHEIYPVNIYNQDK